MPRYILIDRTFRYIWGDTANYPLFQCTEQTPIAAAQFFDQFIKEEEEDHLGYREVPIHELVGCSGYLVYSPTESDALPPIEARNKTMMETVMRNCRFVCAIEQIDIPF